MRIRTLCAAAVLISASTSRLETAAEVTFSNPVIAGDYPDPTIMRVGDRYWATSTTSEWAPIFPLFTSRDLVNWTLQGAVFSQAPAWSQGSYWAPELSEYRGAFYVYYAARNESHTLCIAVAKAERPGGPYRDYGPLVCQPHGSIDPMAAVDENGDRYLIWKEDGNSVQQPTPIWAQRLSEDGTKLVGEPTELIRNTAEWEGPLVEGPFILRRGGYFYLFYSGGGCCGLKCNYKVGVARAAHLLGPWLKYSGNPILSGNESWMCPGHGSIVEDAHHRDFFLYHSYNAKTSIFVGREAMLDEVNWTEDGWPSIDRGQGPSVSAPSPFGRRQLEPQATVDDDLQGPDLRPGWQWPWSDHPVVRFDSKDSHWMTLQADAAHEGEFVGAVLARDVPSGEYTATVAIDPQSLEAGVTAGLTAYGNRQNAFGIGVGAKGLTVWRTQNGDMETTAEAGRPETPVLYLRMDVKNGREFLFAYSSDGSSWHDLKEATASATLPPWDLGVRAALTCCGGVRGASARFRSFHLTARRVSP